jgi:hypothetical protein
MNAGNPFDEVACIIAQGDPPGWLAPSLERSSKAFGPDWEITPDLYHRFKNRIERMRGATDTLIDVVRLFDPLPAGLLPPFFTAFQESLAPLKQWLNELSGRPGRRPYFARELCADLIVFYWKVVHGMAEPGSEKVYQACEDYWQACGGDASGDIESWRRMVAEASARDDLFLMHNMLILLLGTDPEPK